MTPGHLNAREMIAQLYGAYGAAGVSNFAPDDLPHDAPLRAGAFTLVQHMGGVVLIRRKPIQKHPGIERFWWIPGGAVEQGESIAEAAVREFLEETGLRIGIDKVVLAGMRASNGFLYFFLAGHVLDGAITPESDPTGQTAEVHCFHPAEVPVQDVWGELNKIVLAREQNISCGDLASMYDAFYRKVLPV